MKMKTKLQKLLDSLDSCVLQVLNSQPQISEQTKVSIVMLTM